MASKILSKTNILDYLSEEEKSGISSQTGEKLNKEWKSKQEEILKLQIEIEKSRINYEQQSFQKEKDVISLRDQLGNEGKLKTEALQRLESLEKKVTTQNETLQKANDRINSLLRQLDHCRTEQESSATQSAAMAGTLESRSRLINELKEQIRSLEEQVATAHRSKCNAMIEAEEANTLKMQLQYKERRHDQEKGLLKRQLEVLQEQLEQRAEEVLTMRREHSTSLLSLQADLNHSSEEVRVLREERDTYQKIIEEKTKKIEELLATLSESRESESRLEYSYRQELTAQEKLANIYKAASEDQKQRSEELEKGLEELRQLLQESSEQYGALEKAKAKSEEDAQIALDQSNLLVKDLKDELDKVNEILKNSSRKDANILAEMSPAASAASQLMSKGLTLSQLYTEYLNTSEKLMRSEEENKRVTRYLEQILLEIEEKAPILRKQREDYERALETINALHSQIDDSIEEVEKQRLDSEEAQRRANFLGRENDRFHQQVKDLSKQVTVLLTQVEAARAGMPAPPMSILENYTNGGCASDVIGEHLVAFRDVGELQEQNQKLLSSLRDLSEKLESSEKTVVEAKTQELNNELEAARKDLNELKASRDRMQSMVDNITHQRDMYRTLVNQQSPRNVHQAQSHQQQQQVSTKEMNKLKADLERSLQEIIKLKKDHEEYRQEKAKNDILERNEIEKLRSSLEKFRNENIKLLSQAEYNEERLKTLQNNCDAYHRQINGLEEKSVTMQGIIGRHEGTIGSLRDHILSLTKKLSQSEVMTANLREEKSLLKESEARLLAERDSLHHSQYSQSLVLSNLEAIKNNLDKNDSEAKMRYENQISELTEQCSRLKAKIESNTDLKEAKLKTESLENILKASKEEVSMTKKMLAETKQQLVSVSSQLQELQEKIKITGSSSPALTKQRSVIGSPQTPTVTPTRPGAVITHTVRELQVQLSEERAKTTSLKAMADQTQSSLINLKHLYEHQEAQLKESSEANKAAEDEITKLRNNLVESEKLVKDLKEKLQASEESEKALKDTMNDHLMKLTEDLEERENELEETQKQLEDLKNAEAMARSTCREQSRIAADMQEKYEREVMLHGADLHALAALKEKLATHNSELELIVTAKLKAEESLNVIKASFEERESMLKKANEEMKTRGEELEEQNKSLLDQFTQLSDKMSAIHKKLSTNAGEGANTSFTDDEARSSDQLREILKYLRKERDLAASKAEVAQTESLRLEAQRKSLEAQVNLLNKYLAEEREKNQTSLESAGKYGEMMRKVQTMDALVDSNRLLRTEKETLKTSLEELKAKTLSLETQIEPLQEELRESKNAVESLMVEKKSLENESDLYKKRSQELIEKLNKARPEDIIKLQHDLNGLNATLRSKEGEINRLKNVVNHLQKSHQAIVANKNQLQFQLQNAREETKKLVEENKKIVMEKNRIQQQALSSMEKIQVMEAAMHHSQATQLQEQNKNKLEKNQLLQQLVEVRQKEEVARREMEAAKKELLVANQKIEGLEKQCLQLRKIATKYKKKSEATQETSDTTEAGTVAGEEELGPSGGDRVKELEEKNSTLRQQLESLPKKEDVEKLQETLHKFEEEVRKKDEELNKLNSEKDGSLIKLQADMEIKNQDLQKATVAYTQLKDNVTKQIDEINKSLNESQSKKCLYESRIMKLEGERNQLMQHNAELNKKLLMQQKQLENLQKQAGGSKVSPSVISMEKPTSDPPPTANIKPMAAPTPAVVSSPRSQGTAQGSSLRTIPTASIRPMAPTSSPSGQANSSIVVVQPMESHSSGDGAVSSTVTLPQATVTPTPVVPSLAPTLAFPSTLTATVSPTSVSASTIVCAAPFPQPQTSSSSHMIVVPPLLEETSEVTQTTTGIADALISQAIALVTPQVEERPTGQKRKLELDENEEETDEDAKRSRIAEEQALEDDIEEDMQAEEDAGEPSSSSSHPADRKVEEEDEILILSSDDEGAAVPSSQSEQVGVVEEAEESHEGGREAEAESIEDPPVEVPSSASSSLQPPPRPVHEPPSSSRQSLAPFHQLPQYEEGVDDRIVPSTPTLFVSRPCEGTSGDGVSSPQVPSQGFEFGANIQGTSEEATPSNDDLSQIAEGGTIDVTRMDLGQLDEGTHRSLPTTPVRRSPAVEISAEGNISSSGGDIEASSEAINSADSFPPDQSVAELHVQQNEPDSVIQMDLPDNNRDVSEVEELGGRSGEGEDVVSSQELEEGENNDDETNQIEPEEEEDQEVEEEEELEQEGEEEEEQEEEEEVGASFSPPQIRATRSSQGRRITPITWDDSARQQRSPQRGTSSKAKRTPRGGSSRK